MIRLSKRSALLTHSAVSIVDQAWLSILNLLVGLLLIRLVSKEEYGIYTQLFVAGIFAAAITEALISSPLTTLAASYSQRDRTALIAHLSLFQGKLSTGLAVLAGLACALADIWISLPHPVWLTICYMFYIKSNAVREYQRSILFLEGMPQKVLMLDLLYGVVTVVGIALLLLLDWLSVAGIFGMLAVANVVALGRRRITVAAPADAQVSYRSALREAWKRGRLSLPGAMLSWVINYSYLYVTAAWLGATSAADLNASRLLLMPIALSVVAWSRVARPMIGTLLAQQNASGLRRLLVLSTVGIEGVTLAYIGVLWLVLPWLQQHVLGEKYANVDSLVLAWGIYFAINAARWVGTAALMGADRYGFTLCVAIVSLVLVLGGTTLLIPRFDTIGAIMALILVESVSLMMIWGAFIYTSRQRAQR